MAPKRRNSAASVAPEVDASTGKRARKQTIEQLAAKAIKDSCKGMSEEMTHVVRNAKGESLFEVVVQELQKQKALGLSRLGALRWREIRDQFRQLAWGRRAAPAPEGGRGDLPDAFQGGHRVQEGPS